MGDAEAEESEDNGYKKSAGPMWAYAGGLIGFVITTSIFWYFASRR